MRVGRYKIYVVSKLYGFMGMGPGISALRGIAMKPSALNLVKSRFRSIYAKTIHFLVAKVLLENGPVFFLDDVPNARCTVQMVFSCLIF